MRTSLCQDREKERTTLCCQPNYAVMSVGATQELVSRVSTSRCGHAHLASIPKHLWHLLHLYDHFFKAETLEETTAETLKVNFTS